MNGNLLDLTHPAPAEFVARNGDAKRPFAGWERLLVLSVRQEGHAVDEVRTKFGQ
jgi:hypothetical protein